MTNSIDIYFLTKIHYTITILKVKQLQRLIMVKVELDPFSSVRTAGRSNDDRSDYCLIQ